MAVEKLTFDGASITATRDAEVNHYLTGRVEAGVLYGLGGNLESSFANNYMTFQSGYVQIYGRRIYIPEGTNIYISLNGNAYGTVYLEVDLALNKVGIYLKEASTMAQTLNLTKQNLLNGGRIYQFILCKYQKTATSLNKTSGVESFIYDHKHYANMIRQDLERYMLNRYDPKTVRTYTYSSDSKKFRALIDDNTYDNINTALIILRLSTGQTISIPGWKLNFLSAFTVAFSIGSSTYTVGVDISNRIESPTSYIYFNFSASGINADSIYIYF